MGLVDDQIAAAMSAADPSGALNNGLNPLRKLAGKPKLGFAQEQGLLSSLASGAMSGLEYAGSSLDKLGGRTVRSLLGGRPLGESFAHLVPFSDAAGLTDPSTVPSGRGLLEQQGMLGPNQPGLDLGDVGGFLAEVALDPTTYVTGGAKALTQAGLQASKAGVISTKALGAARTASEVGDVARAAGQLAPDLASRIAAGQGGLLGLRLPFAGDVLPIGTGPVAQGVAEKFLAPAAEKILGAPGIRHVRSMLSPSVGPVANRAVQIAHEATARPEMAKALAAGRNVQVGLLRGASKAGAYLTEASKREFDEIALQAAEKVDTLPASFAALQAARPDTALTPDLFNAAINTGNEVAKWHEGVLNLAQDLGVPKHALVDQYVQYITRVKKRHPDMPTDDALKGFAQQFGATTGSDIAREGFLKDMPGGTVALNKLAKDTAVSGSNRVLVDQAAAAAHIRDNYLRLPEAQAALQAAKAAFGAASDPIAKKAAGEALGAAAARVAGIRRQATQLAKWTSNLDPRYAGEGLDFFDPNVLGSMDTAIQRTARMQSSAEAVHEIARRFSVEAGKAGPDAISVPDFLKKAGLTKDDIDPNMGAISGALHTQATRSGMLDAMGFADPGKLAGRVIPKDIADAAVKYLGLWSKPEEVKGLLKLYDKALNLFKTSVTQIFPGFHVRNLQDGIFRNYIAGGASFRSMQDALSALRGGPIQITEAMKRNGLHSAADVIDAAFAHSVAFTGEQGGEIGGTIAKGGKPSIPGIDGKTITTRTLPSGATLTTHTTKSVGEVAKDWLKGFAPSASGVARKDKKWRDWLDSSKDVNRVFAQGAALGNSVEDFNRMSHFIEKLRQGYNPAEAAAQTKATHFQYADTSNFEKAVMKRLMPFYVFSRKNLPWWLEQLMQEPGKIATPTRALNSGRDKDRFTPPWVSGSGTAIPLDSPLFEAILGKSPDGHDRYLTGLGLGAIEEPVQRFHVGPGGLKQTAYDHLSMLNPLLKMPLEMLSGEQFFSGRELQDLEPSKLFSAYGLAPDAVPEALSKPASQILMNSPLARVSTTMDKLADDRKSALAKALNTLTGAKITDVDREKAKAGTARTELKRRLDEASSIREYTGYYAPEGTELDPEEETLLRYWEAQRRNGRARQR